MIEARIFDGTIGREGINILAEVFKNDDLRRIMLNPMNPSPLRNDSWNFGSKVTLMKAADHFLEKMIHGLVGEPAMDDFDKPEYPGHYWDFVQDDRNNSASLC
ncbi:hypothetical protein CY34DRAFT_19790 [Suillus luteus UH-Slu-Lm8-n1]|uniref:Uncharacterized protein n=1 Tax=Suillus luteus UH-Slu-Lm8-n1 TaxID=930992 RepID=A0A0D0ABG9_9AGAM|nr:hypothetical protein CY34DRAFT_19790 [Suillus luteus UH-Slu-Lm8-n1]